MICAFRTYPHLSPLATIIHHLFSLHNHSNPILVDKSLKIAKNPKKAYTFAMKNLFEQLKKHPIVYVTRDIERALGLSLDTPGFFVVTNESAYADAHVAGQNNILLIEEDEQLNTRQLLEHPDVQAFIHNIPHANVLVFKNSDHIERICRTTKLHLLNPSVSIANEVEEKISQIDWLGELTSLCPQMHAMRCEDLPWNDEQYIVQFNHGHTGMSTQLIESETQVHELRTKFPLRDVRVCAHIPGPVITSNNVVTPHNILVGNISYQITGLQPFTDLPFATIGNDWHLGTTLLNENQQHDYNNIVKDIGEKLRQQGWRGLFGIDVAVHEETGKLYLLEINARQPASTTFESQLQRRHSEAGFTIFQAHLAALFKIDVSQDELININTGAQLVQRVNPLYPDAATARDELQEQFLVIHHENDKRGDDLLRIQTEECFVEAHGVLNQHGALVTQIINATNE